MTKNKKTRIEIRFDEIEDKDMIDFIDNNGSTRAGFIKQVLKMYKNQMETTMPDTVNNNKTENNDEADKKQEKEKPQKINDVSFSSKDLN